MYYFIEPKYLLKGAEYDCHSLSSHVDVFGPCKKIGNSVQHYCHYILPAAFLACMRVVFFFHNGVEKLWKRGARNNQMNVVESSHWFIRDEGVLLFEDANSQMVCVEWKV